MNFRQKLFLGAWALMISVVAVGPLYFSSGEFLILFVAASAIVSLFKGQITPKTASPPSPLQILEQSYVWRAIAILYTTVIVIVVIRHVFVESMPFFDNVPLATLLLLILGPAIGPFVIVQVTTYKMLGVE